MTKTLVARHELERIALQEIRSFPGCEYVTDIEIAYQVDRALRTNWTIHVFTREGGDMLRIQYEITTIRNRLRPRYDLRTTGSPSTYIRSPRDWIRSVNNLDQKFLV